MATNSEVLKQQVLTYLQDYFSEVAITESGRMFSDDGEAFRIQADGEEYQIRILDEVIAEQGVEQIVDYLVSNNAVVVMRELAGFPVTMTNNGCMFYDV